MKDIATSQFKSCQLKFISVNFVDCACIDETQISIINMITEFSVSVQPNQIENSVESSHNKVGLSLHVIVKPRHKKSTYKKLFDGSTYLQASYILFTMTKEHDIEVANIIHHIENELNEKDDDNELKNPPGSENAQLFLSCGLDSLKIEKW